MTLTRRKHFGYKSQWQVKTLHLGGRGGNTFLAQDEVSSTSLKESYITGEKSLCLSEIYLSQNKEGNWFVLKPSPFRKFSRRWQEDSKIS